MYGCTTDTQHQRNLSLYKNTEAQKIAHQSYDRALQLWRGEYTEDWVDTEYGNTHIIVSGPNDGKPVFLIPGLFADATMWYANAGALASEYRVYAVDLPVYGGKSRPSDTPISDVNDYLAWFSALINHYEYEEVTVAGLSYGSWISLALAREAPDIISNLIMLDPSETFMKMRSGMMWKGLWYFMIFPSRGKYARFFDWMGGGYSDREVDIWFEHMLDVIQYGAVGMMEVPQHRIYAAEELTMITMPVLIVVGGKPIIYKCPELFMEAAQKALPKAETVMVPETGHSLNMEKPEQVNRIILNFLRNK